MLAQNGGNSGGFENLHDDDNKKVTVTPEEMGNKVKFWFRESDFVAADIVLIMSVKVSTNCIEVSVPVENFPELTSAVQHGLAISVSISQKDQQFEISIPSTVVNMNFFMT